MLCKPVHTTQSCCLGGASLSRALLIDVYWTYQEDFDAALAALTCLSGLTRLCVSCTRIGGEGLRQLGSLQVCSVKIPSLSSSFLLIKQSDPVGP